MHDAPAADRSRRYSIALLLLTLFSAGLRLTTLSRPEIWGDEAATYHRVASSYADLLAILRQDGFVPLHYELYWAMARWFTLTPAMLRLVPAIAGTLLTPAIYFLARQIHPSRGVALLAAAFAATSAWLMYYSHDAKMYSHFWLFVTIHVACLLAFLGNSRPRLGLVWFLCFTATGLAMVGLHATGMLLIPLDLLILLSHPRTQWLRSLSIGLALLVILAGPAGYYIGFNRFSATLETRGWGATGIQWIEQRNADKPTPLLLADTAAAFLFSYNFIPESLNFPGFGDGGPPPVVPSPKWIAVTAWSALAALLGLAALGAVIPTKQPNPAPLPLPPSLPVFYLAAWIALPTYLFYCASVEGFASPVSILPWFPWAGAGLVFAVTHHPRLRAVRPRSSIVVPLLIIFGLCCLTYLPMSTRHARSIWMPRYLGIIFPAFAIGLGVLYLRLPRPLRYLAIALLLGLNLTQSIARLVVPTEAPVSRVAADVWRDRDARGTGRTYVQIPRSFGFTPGGGNVQSVVGLYHLRLLSKSPLRPVDFRFTPADTITPIHRYLDSHTLAGDLADAPALRSAVVWTTQEPKDVASALAPAWQVSSADSFPVRVYWTWSPQYVYHRIQLQKTDR